MNLCKVHVHARVSGNWVLLNSCNEYLQILTFGSTICIDTTWCFNAYESFNIAFLPAFSSSNFRHTLVIEELIKPKSKTHQNWRFERHFWSHSSSNAIRTASCTERWRAPINEYAVYHFHSHFSFWFFISLAACFSDSENSMSDFEK